MKGGMCAAFQFFKESRFMTDNICICSYSLLFCGEIMIKNSSNQLLLIHLLNLMIVDKYLLVFLANRS